MSNVIPIRPRPPFEPEYSIERERDKLLHVAELLEADAYQYRCEPFFGDECLNCSETRRMTRRFNGMAARIRRFWGAAVQVVPDERVHDLIRSILRLLRGGGPVACDPMSELAILREVLVLRAENDDLRAQVAALREGARQE